jgi:hypothetical protein
MDRSAGGSAQAATDELLPRAGRIAGLPDEVVVRLPPELVVGARVGMSMSRAQFAVLELRYALLLSASRRGAPSGVPVRVLPAERDQDKPDAQIAELLEGSGASGH